MTSIWNFRCKHTNPSLMSGLSGRDEPVVCYCEFLNSRAVRDAGYYEGRPRTRPFPILQLKVTHEEFDADFFVWEGREIVSERMRQAMALDPSEVRYFEIDASQSASLPRSKNYQVMEATVVENVSDVEKSKYGVLPFETDVYLSMLMDGRIGNPIKPENRAEFARTFKAGRERMRARLDFTPSPIEAHSIVMRADASPSSDLFYDEFFRARLLCTEALAVRILKAGCTGVKFVDPSRLEFGVKSRYRTMRGIEEYVEWDYVNGIEITKVIQAIDVS